MPYTYDANAAADRFLRMLWDHHADAEDARDTEELLEYVAQDLFSAFQREGIDSKDVLARAAAFTRNHPADARPGYFNPEPDLPTYDEALATKCAAAARMDAARALK